MRRQTFVQQDMFDFHFSPGYYEDTDLAFTMRALGLRVLYQPFAHVFHESHTTYAGSMDALIERNRQHFISKWSAQLRHHMPPCEVAAACRQPHKTMYTHIAATRMYLFRVLWIDQVLPEPDRDSGSIRSLTMIKLLLAMRCHVSIVTVKRSGNGAHERYTKLLQWLGVHVIPSFRMMAAFTLREPYDFLFVARRDTFAEVRDTLYRQYPNTLLVFDTVDLHFLRERARLQFIQEHAGDTALLLAVFGSAEPSAVLANASLGNVQREVELDAASACAVAVVVSDEERRALRAELLADGREPPAIAVIANAHESAAPTAAPFEGRAGVVFVGNFNHLPNRDAVLFFANEAPRPCATPLPRIASANATRAAVALLAGHAAHLAPAPRATRQGLRLPRRWREPYPASDPGAQPLRRQRISATHRCAWSRPRPAATIREDARECRPVALGRRREGQGEFGAPVGRTRRVHLRGRRGHARDRRRARPSRRHAGDARGAGCAGVLQRLPLATACHTGPRAA